MNDQKTNSLKRTGKRKVRGSDRTFNIIITVFVAIIMMIILYPMIYVVSSSFSSGSAVSSGKVLLWPVDLSVEGYRIIFSVKKVWTGYANSILYWHDIDSSFTSRNHELSSSPTIHFYGRHKNTC